MRFRPAHMIALRDPERSACGVSLRRASVAGHISAVTCRRCRASHDYGDLMVCLHAEEVEALIAAFARELAHLDAEDVPTLFGGTS